MYAVQPSTRVITRVAVAMAGATLLLSCSPSSPTDPGQTVGQIQVVVSSTGTGIPASFSVFLNGGSPRSVSPNGSATFGSLSAGNYQVELVVAANCAISGAATRTVGVQEGSTSTVSYSVSCSAVPTGAIGVTTTTTGAPADPDGYTVSVGGGAAVPIGVNDNLLVADLGLGDHEVALGGVADNCMVQGSNPRTVSVTEDQTTQTEFEVLCSATTGLIDVTVTTAGAELDPDGYVVDLDGAATQRVDANGTTRFTGVEQGEHTLALEDVAPNCTVTTANPLTTDVVAGETTDVGFAVECAATTGSLEVSAATTGDELDQNGYTVSVDGGAEQSIGVNGTTTFADLPAGAHEVELGDVAINCAVAGENPRTVDVIPGATVSATFDVSCSATVGSIQVSVSTTGDAIDDDGYSVVLDGGAATQLVEPDDTIVFGGLAPGEHTLDLQNVAGNCTVTSPNPATAEVTAGQQTGGAFTVECEELTGSIQVDVGTTGAELDPNGYTVSLDGGAGLSIAINGSRTFSDVVIGAHEVRLTGVASNCAVQGSNPRSVTVSENATAQVDFDVICSATAGQIEVTVTTTGDDLDPNGYTVDLDGTSSEAVATNGSTTFTGVPAGNHTLTLQNIASNCDVTSPNPTSTNVTAGNTSNVSFTVECTRTTGDIRVTTSTTGSPPDPNGYTVSVDGGGVRTIGNNDQELFLDLQPGGHTVTLSDVAVNCTVVGGAVRSPTVNADDETVVAYSVVCAPLVGDIQLNVSTTGEDLDTGYTALLDGGSGQSVEANGSTTFTDVSTGSHSITLTGVASNCSVAGDNPKNVTVLFGTTVDVDFDVTCAGLTGDLEATTQTSGAPGDLDPDGYTIEVDGAPVETIDVNETKTVTDLPVGVRSVELSGVAGNCTVSGANPRNVNVPAGGTASTTFEVDCDPTTGSIEVTTTTSGTPDPDGYLVDVDGGAAEFLDDATPVVFDGLTPASYSVTLTGLDGGCVVDPPNPAMPTVVAGGTEPVDFVVTCP